MVSFYLFNILKIAESFPYNKRNIVVPSIYRISCDSRIMDNVVVPSIVYRISCDSRIMGNSSQCGRKDFIWFYVQLEFTFCI